MKSILIIPIAALAFTNLHAEDKVQAAPAKPVIANTVRFQFDHAVRQQLLGKLNPKGSLVSRFSRVRRPLPSQYYDAEIARAISADLYEFHIVRIDRSNPREPKREVREIGRFHVKLGKVEKVELYDTAERAFVPAEAHPLLGGKSAKS